jgi:hypothetical protein
MGLGDPGGVAVTAVVVEVVVEVVVAVVVAVATATTAITICHCVSMYVLESSQCILSVKIIQFCFGVR